MRRDNRSARKKADAASDDESALLIAVRCAQRDDEEAKLLLLARFEPLCLRCAHEARRRLPGEDLGVCQSEATYQFLLLLNEFDAERGVPFAGFLKAMMPRRVLGWARKERLRHQRETPLSQMRSEEQENDSLEEDADRLARLHGIPTTEPPEEKTDWKLSWPALL